MTTHDQAQRLEAAARAVIDLAVEAAKDVEPGNSFIVQAPEELREGITPGELGAWVDAALAATPSDEVVYSLTIAWAMHFRRTVGR